MYLTPGYTPELSIHEKTFETDPTTLDKRPWEPSDDNAAFPGANGAVQAQKR